MSDQSASFVRVGITPILILVYGAYYLSDTWGSRFETVGYGALCGTILLILVLVIAGRGIRDGNASAALIAWFADQPTALRLHTPAAVMALSMLAYVIAQPIVGFLPATALAAPWILYFLRAGGAQRIVLESVFLTAMAWVILLELLNVPLPSGPLGV